MSSIGIDSPWTPYEEKRLIFLKGQNKKNQDIATQLHRTLWSIEHKIFRLGIERLRKEKEGKEIVGFLDIETTNLNADIGFMVCYCILDNETGKVIKRKITLEDLNDESYDKNLLKQFALDWEQFDRFVVHYGTDYKFDLPFVRTRSVFWGISNFPLHKFLYCSDTHGIAKAKFRFHSNRLQAMCDFFSIPSKLHRLNWKVFNRLMTGNKKLMQWAINTYLIHCVEDVESLAAIWKRISKYAPLTNRSV